MYRGNSDDMNRYPGRGVIGLTSNDEPGTFNEPDAPGHTTDETTKRQQPSTSPGGDQTLSAILKMINLTETDDTDAATVADDDRSNNNAAALLPLEVVDLYEALPTHGPHIPVTTTATTTLMPYKYNNNHSNGNQHHQHDEFLGHHREVGRPTTLQSTLDYYEHIPTTSQSQSQPGFYDDYFPTTQLSSSFGFSGYREYLPPISQASSFSSGSGYQDEEYHPISSSQSSSGLPTEYYSTLQPPPLLPPPGYHTLNFGQYTISSESSSSTTSTSTAINPPLTSIFSRPETAGASPLNNTQQYGQGNESRRGPYDPFQRFGLPNVYRTEGPAPPPGFPHRSGTGVRSITEAATPTPTSTSNNNSTTTTTTSTSSGDSTGLAITSRRLPSTHFQHPFLTRSGLSFPSPLSRSGSTTLHTLTGPMDPHFLPLANYMVRTCLPPRTAASTTTNPQKISILNVCEQVSVVPIKLIFDHLKNIKKIGEGVFGEVYTGQFKEQPDITKVYKVIPIEGDRRVNGEKQKRYQEIEPEIIISKRLNFLRKIGLPNYTEGFSKLSGALICKGVYPASLFVAWREYQRQRRCENDVPVFRENQEYVVLESDLYGCDVEAFHFKNAKEAFSILIQVAHTLAVGESGVKFEHRDLHWGNILVMTTTKKHVHFKVKDIDSVINIPTCGLKSTIIDFTIASIENDDGKYIYTDLSHDETQFKGFGDYQFEIYRMMRLRLKNKWNEFTPKNNIYWMHYLVDKLMKCGRYSEPSGFVHDRYMDKLQYFKSIVLEFDSCSHFAYCYPEESFLEINAVELLP